MLFNSLSYFIFFPVVCCLYFILPKALKNPMLLVASFYFYMCWNVYYALLMLSSITITYVAGLLIQQSTPQALKKLWVFISLALNLLILFFFKYYNFAIALTASIYASLGKGVPSFRLLDIILPVGISFYTFQALGYTIDVYRNKLKAQHNFFQYALFVSFFPQLVAGPIERAPHLMKQFDTTYPFQYQRVKSGIYLIGWGLFKKVIIADRIAILVNTVFNHVGDYEGQIFLVGACAFSIQIYCDFSGYSDIAIGSARVLGFDLMKNFDAPYLSRSIGEFWRRWHISLSSWFRDYVYFPLGGNRKGNGRKLVNQMIVFLVSGLWHGAGLTFILWGFLNGCYLMLSELCTPMRQRLLHSLRLNPNSQMHQVFQTMCTFGLITFAFIFFRANSIGDALVIVKHLWYPNFWVYTDGSLLRLGLDLPDMLLCLAAIFVLFYVDKNNKKIHFGQLLMQQPFLYRWSVYFAVVIGLLIFGVYGGQFEQVNFLYFQF